MTNFTVERLGRGTNGTTVTLGQLVVHFSYKTPIAFVAPGPDGRRRVVRRNDWNNTTGRHLTAVDGGGKAAKAARIGGVEFEAQLGHVLADLTSGVRSDSVDKDEKRDKLAVMLFESLPIACGDYSPPRASTKWGSKTLEGIRACIAGVC